MESLLQDALGLWSSWPVPFSVPPLLSPVSPLASLKGVPPGPSLCTDAQVVLTCLSPGAKAGL